MPKFSSIVDFFNPNIWGLEVKKRRLLWGFSLFQFFFSLLVWVPVFIEIQQRLGLNHEQIYSIQNIYYLVFCFIELPTGWFADRYGYRFSMAIGAFFLVCANGVVFLDSHYAGFLVHFIGIALARSFVSGAGSAYLYDSLNQLNAEEEYRVWEGRARALSLVGKVICWWFVGLWMSSSLLLPYAITAVFAGLSLLVVAGLPRFSQSYVQKGAWKEVLQLVNEDRGLFWVMVQGVSLFVVTRIAQVNLYQPILVSRGFSASGLGQLMAIMTLVEAVASSYGVRWFHAWDDQRLVAWSSVLLMIPLVVWSFPTDGPIGGAASASVAYLFFSFLTGLAFPFQRRLMNRVIGDPSLRARVLSLESLLDRAINSVVVLAIPAALANHRLSWFLGAAAICVLVFVALASYRLARLQRSCVNENLA